MPKKFLTQKKAEDLVAKYMLDEGDIVTTQEILNSGVISELSGFVVRRGKVSDCIHGGKGSFVIKKEEEETCRSLLNGLNVTNWRDFTVKGKKGPEKKVEISFENPPLTTANDEPLFIPVRTERVSTHDKERGSIPFKDQVLALNHFHMLNLVRNILGTSQFDVPGLAPNSVVLAAEQLKQIGFENVLRDRMAKSSTETSLYHHYVKGGKRNFAGHLLPDGLFANCKLPYIMDTPSTKSAISDETVEPNYLFRKKICTPYEYFQLRNSAINSFVVIQIYLLKLGIILADTKTEHGYTIAGLIKSQDELYTMDSSRYWLLKDYMRQLELYLAGEEKRLVTYLKRTQPGIEEKDYVVDERVIICPLSLSKEFARGFSKGDGKYTDEERAKIAVRYIIGSQHILKQKFEPDMKPWSERVISGLGTVMDQVVA